MRAAAASPLAAAGGATSYGRVLYRLGLAVARLLLSVLSPIRVEGQQNVPRRGPLLVVANHTSFVDPMLLAVAVPRPVAFLAKEELFHPAIWGWALRSAGIIPVRRGRADRAALAAALAVLENGGAVAVFAEGTRSADGALRPAEPGAGLLAARAGAPVSPVALLGTEQVRSMRDWLRRPRLLARCGPVWQPAAEAGGRSPVYGTLADAMMARVAALMPAGRRGRYAQTAADVAACEASGRGEGTMV